MCVCACVCVCVSVESLIIDYLTYLSCGRCRLVIHIVFSMRTALTLQCPLLLFLYFTSSAFMHSVIIYFTLRTHLIIISSKFFSSIISCYTAPSTRHAGLCYIFLRRQQLLRTMQYILSSDDLFAHLTDLLKSPPPDSARASLCSLPVWWCPWIHDIGAYVTC